MKINYKSDFDFAMRLKDCTGKEIPFPECDWDAVFWTSSKANAYTASCKEGECVNCFIEETGGMHFVFDNHRLGIGTLKWEPHFELPNDIYPDGIQDRFSKEPLGVELVEGAGDCPTETEVELTVPYAVVDAYMTARAAGFDGTAEEYYAGLGMLPSLAALASDLREGKKAVADALTRRGYPTEPTDSMESMAATIGGMSYGAGDFARLGYTDTPEYIREQIQYGIDLTAEWDKCVSALLPVKTTGDFFSKLPVMFLSDIDCGVSGVDMGDTFLDCSRLISVGRITGRITGMRRTFQGCSSLHDIESIDMSNVSGVMYTTFMGCNTIERLPELDVRGITEFWWDSFACRNLKYIRLLNFGQAQALKNAYITKAPQWGAGSEENRRSLVDSLLTCSHDRVASGYEPATVTLSAVTKGLLTPEEIAAITAKGFTIA